MIEAFNNSLKRLPDVVAKQFREFLPQFARVIANDELMTHPLFIQTAPKVIGASQYVRDLCLAQPSLVADLFLSGDISRVQHGKYFQQKYQQYCGNCQELKQLYSPLRLLRQREMLRIAWRDMAGWADLSETLFELSALADTIIARTADTLCKWHHELYGTPVDEQGKLAEFIILALGKLGGRELNFSSDVDLIFAYSGSGNTNGKRSLSNEQFFTKVARNLINVLNEVTTEGFVFRVDMRLRPYGDSGPLVMTSKALGQYYHSQGRDWERYALVKARVIYGSQQCQKQIAEIIKPFVYRRYIDYGVIASLRELKHLLDRETKRRQLQDNIKRGPGGIREIEFIVQAFQIIRGGKENFLQSTSLLTALHYIKLIEELPDSLVADLLSAYKFLRILENRLQMLHDRQTQELPGDTNSQHCLVSAMGLTSWDELLQKLAYHRKRVKLHFNNTISSRHAEVEHKLQFNQLRDLVAPDLSDDEAKQILTSISTIKQPDKLYEVIKQLNHSPKLKSASARGKERLNDFIPYLLDRVINNDDADQVLRRVIPIIESIAKRSAYVALLLENPIALDNLITYCARSSWIATKIANYPLLLDELLVTYKHKPTVARENLIDELKHMLISVPREDTESQMEFMRQFKHTHEVRAAIYELSDLLSTAEISDYLSMVAEVIVEQCYFLVLQRLVAKYGYPQDAAGQAKAVEFMIVAYGKLGSQELSYESDLDLVFLHGGDTQLTTNGLQSLSQGEFYVRLGQRLINALSARTASGELYNVDVRLRPSGSAGMLVSQFDAYQRYQLEQAWTWEHQALVRARPVLGPENLLHNFSQVRQKVLQQQRDVSKLRQDIIDMRAKMLTHKSGSRGIDLKQSIGGVTDIEFLVQYCVLRWSQQHGDLVTFRSNQRLLQQLMNDALLPEADAQTLATIYMRYRQALHQQILCNESGIEHAEWQQCQAKVLKIWEKSLKVQKKNNNAD